MWPSVSIAMAAAASGDNAICPCPPTLCGMGAGASGFTGDNPAARAKQWEGVGGTGAVVAGFPRPWSRHSKPHTRSKGPGSIQAQPSRLGVAAPAWWGGSGQMRTTATSLDAASLDKVLSVQMSERWCRACHGKECAGYPQSGVVSKIRKERRCRVCHF